MPSQCRDLVSGHDRRERRAPCDRGATDCAERTGLMFSFLARLRVPLGFVAAAIAFGVAKPTWRSWTVGFIVAAIGELLRLWAAGHIDKGREITRSGPYRFVRHPLYFGSSILGTGFVIAAQSVFATVIVLVYLAVTLTAAVRTEEERLDERFQG